MLRRFVRAQAPRRERPQRPRCGSCLHVARREPTGNGTPMGGQLDDEFVKLLEAMKRTGGVLNDAGIPWVLGGGLACWARGGPTTEHDVDVLVTPDDAPRAQEALAAAGMRAETPPEGWLLK